MYFCKAKESKAKHLCFLQSKKHSIFAQKTPNIAASNKKPLSKIYFVNDLPVGTKGTLKTKHFCKMILKFRPS